MIVMLEQELEAMRQVFCVTLRARSVNGTANKRKRRGRQARYGSIETSGTARVRLLQVSEHLQITGRIGRKMRGMSLE